VLSPEVFEAKARTFKATICFVLELSSMTPFVLGKKLALADDRKENAAMFGPLLHTRGTCTWCI